MKKVAIVVLLMAGLTAMAQRGPQEGRKAMSDLTPEQMADLQTKKMTLALDLTTGQQEQIKALNLEKAKMRKAKMEERKNMKEAGDRKKPTSDERYAMQNERLDQMIAQKAEMKNILSDEQYSKWEKMLQRQAQHQKGKEKIICCCIDCLDLNITCTVGGWLYFSFL